MLTELSNTVTGTSLDLHISIFITCLCNPQAIPEIPNSIVTVERPSVHNLLHGMITPPDDDQDLKWVGLGGGLGVCVGGPESLTAEVSNAVARLSLSRGVELGGIELHTELFSL
jgi:ferric-chelate reductase